MIRKSLISALALIALTFGAFTATADAQVCSYNQRISGQCQLLTAQPDGPTGPLTAINNAGAGANVAGSVESDAAALAQSNGASNPDAQSSLAFTGVESSVLGLAGAGLIGVGSLALVAARRRHTDEG